MSPARLGPLHGDGPHRLIAGDNLPVLKALLAELAGGVRMIFIDPPYNRGEDFAYRDRYRLTRRTYLRLTGQRGPDAETRGARHAPWLSMMLPRLILARELLRDDGVMFVCIDDSEVHNLRHLLDEVFGEDNFLASVVWQRRTSPDARVSLGSAHDYLLVVARDAGQVELGRVPLRDERRRDFRNPDSDPRGPWASVDLTGQTGHATPTQFYEVALPSGRAVGPPEGRCWAMSAERLAALRADGRLWFGRNGDRRPRMKRFLSENEGATGWTWWPHAEVGHNQEATRELRARVGPDAPDMNPKPTRLVTRCLRLATRPCAGDVVLDFFAGTGTTGEAVLRLNAADGGDRRAVLVQIPEALDHPRFDTLTDVTLARLSSVESAVGGPGFAVQSARS